MASLINEDRIKETTTTEGSGNVTLAGAATGFRTFASVMANNDTCLYCIQGGAEWEVGIGTFVSATPALARTTILASSNSNNVVTLSAGTKDVFITATSERMVLPHVTADPAAPAGAAVYMYSKSLAGRIIPRWIGPSGLDSATQPSLWGNSVLLWLPGAGTTAAISFGCSWTVSATQAHPAIADTNVMTKMRRATYTTTTTAANQSGARTTAAATTRNAGFFFAARAGILTYTSTMRIFIGLNGASGAMNGDASAVNDSCGFCKDTGKTVWQYGNKDTVTPNYTDTGRTTAAGGAAEVFDFMMFCKPGDSKITYRMVDVATPATIVDNVEKSTNLPTGTTILYPHAECQNQAGGAGSAVAIFLGKLYMEMDI